MNRQAQIDAFLLAAHRLALTRVAARHPDHATRARGLAGRGAPAVNRRQLEHVLRAAAAIADEPSFAVVGSQAVLSTHPDAPAALSVSREASAA